MDRIKRLSLEILERHKPEFGTDFKENKMVLEKISIIRSKGLKNEIAGFITKYIKHELLDKKIQEERLANQEKLDAESEENYDVQQENLDLEAQPVGTSYTKKQPNQS